MYTAEIKWPRDWASQVANAAGVYPVEKSCTRSGNIVWP